MPFIGPISVVSLTAASWFVLILSIILLRKKHPTIVYTLWYTFFLTFFIALVLRYAINEVGSSGSAALSGYWATLSSKFEDFASDIETEISFLTVLFVLIVMPQVSSYLVSGLFGCGSPPKFVQQISKYIFWSFVKTLCIFAGVSLVTPIFILLITGLFSVEGAVLALTEFSGPTLALAAAFFLSATYYRGQDIAISLSTKIKFNIHNSFNSFMTRFNR